MNNNWTNEEELKNSLIRLTNENNTVSGIPLSYDEESIYVDNKSYNNLILGASGSGKTQATLLPSARLAIRNNEGLLIYDHNNEIQKKLKNDLDKYNYKTITIDLNDYNSNTKYNILSLPYKIYKNGEKDKAIQMIDNITKILIGNDKITGDPFWEESSLNYLKGIILYLFETSNSEVNIKDCYSLASSFEVNNLNSFEKTSPTYTLLSNTVLAPKETRASILSVFTQKINILMSREQFLSIIDKTTINFEDIINSNTAIFISSNNNNSINSRIVPIIISQLFELIQNNNTNKINVFIDILDELKKIPEFDNILSNSRKMNTRLYIYINNLTNLVDKIGNDTFAKYLDNFDNIIYLFSQDEMILNLIEKLTDKLITTSELRTLNIWEAIILKKRIKPIKTKLLPDYNYPWSK